MRRDSTAQALTLPGMCREGCERRLRVIIFTLFDALVAAHITRRPWQVVAAICALVFGATSMSALLTANRAVTDTAGAAVARLSPDVNLQLTATKAFSDRFVAIAQHVPGVSAARPVIDRRLSVETPAGHDIRVRFIGTDLLAPVFVDETARTDLLPGPYSPSGAVASPAQLVNAASVIIDERLSSRAGVGTHAQLTLRAQTVRRAVAIVDVVRDDETGSGDARMFADIDNAQAWLGISARVDRIDCVVDPNRLADVHAQLVRLVPATIVVSEPLTRTQAIIESTHAIAFALRLIALFAGLLAAFAAYHLFGAAVVQRQGDVATLRSLGVERIDVLRAFVIEALLYGVFGSVVGLACGLIFAGVAVAAAIAFASPFATAPPIAVDARDAVVVLAFGIVTTLIAAIVPAWRALGSDGVAERRNPFNRDATRGAAYVASAVGAVAIVATVEARITHDQWLPLIALAAGVILAAMPVRTLTVRAFRLSAHGARRSDVRIAAALGIAHAGRSFFAAIPIVTAIAALCVASALVTSERALLANATQAVFGADASAVLRSFDLTYAFLRGAIVLLIAVAAIAIGSIWFGALLERRAAYTTLRSLGMSVAEIARSIFIEVLVVAGLSCAAGLVTGLLGIYLIARFNGSSHVVLAPAISISSIAGFTFAMLAIACIATVPAIALVSRGSLRAKAE